MKLNKQFENVPIYQPGKPIEEVKRELGLKEIIKLASNENPFGSSGRIREKLMQELHQLHIYPDGAGAQLKSEISDLYSINKDKIILGNGSDEIIQYISRAYLNQNTEVIMADVTFPMYGTNAMMEMAKKIEVPLKDGTHDLEAMMNVVTERTTLVWICNPNNPTGTIVREEEIRDFLEKLPENILVVVDEAYAEYVMDSGYPNTLQLLEDYPNLMVLRTFSKIYGLAALRIGYGLANPHIIQDLEKLREPFNTNRIAQACALEAIKDQDFIEHCKLENNMNKYYFMSKLEEMGLDYYPSETNFILVKLKINDEEVFQKLLSRGIITRAGTKLGIPNTIRITIGNREQMEQVIDAFQQIFLGGGRYEKDDK